MTGAAAALIAVGVLAYLIIALHPGTRTDAGQPAGATPATRAPRAAIPVATKAPSASATPTPAKTTTPATRSARPSATPAQKTAPAAAPLAGRIRPQVTYRGIATFYDAGNGDGACLFGPTSDVMTAAMNHTDYESSKACGAYVLVRAADGAFVTVRITNECPECSPGQLDLSAQAFAKLAAPSKGQIPVTWKLVSPTTVGTLSLRYKTGSSRYWCAVQVLGHRNPVARLELRTGGGFRRLPRTGYDYFVSDSGGGCGGAIRITDIYGEQLTVTGITVRPDVVQPTRVQFARH